METLTKDQIRALTPDQIRALPKSVELSAWNLAWFKHPSCNSRGVVKRFAKGPHRASGVFGTPSDGQKPHPLGDKTTTDLVNNLKDPFLHLEGCGLCLVKDPDDKNTSDPLYIMFQNRR